MEDSAVATAVLVQIPVPAAAAPPGGEMFSHSISLAARKNSVGSDGVTGDSAPRLKASATTLLAIFAVAACAVVGSGTACAHRSALPNRFDSAAQKWSRRVMLTGTASLANVPVAAAPVTSGDANSSLISAGKLKFPFANPAATRRNSGSDSWQACEFA